MGPLGKYNVEGEEDAEATQHLDGGMRRRQQNRSLNKTLPQVEKSLGVGSLELSEEGCGHLCGVVLASEVEGFGRGNPWS